MYPYIIENITPKQIQINRDTRKWNLQYDTFTDINTHPGDPANIGDKVTVTALLRHNVGYNYYLEDASIPYGYNVMDCDDYTPPPPVPEVPQPPVIDVVYNPAPPSAPLPIPTSTEPYEIIKSILGFSRDNDAVHHINAKTSIEAGTYYVYNRRYSPTDPGKLLAINVTKTPGTFGSWINPDDNMPDLPSPPPPVTSWETPAAISKEPELDWRTSYSPFRNKFGDVSPKYYIAMRDIIVPDLETKLPDRIMKIYDATPVAGMFTKDGVTYARPQSGADKFLWYGIPMTDKDSGLPNLELESIIYDTKTTTAERKVTKNLTTHDYLILVKAHIDAFFEKLFSAFTSKNKEK